MHLALLSLIIHAVPAQASWKSNDQQMLAVNDTGTTSGKVAVIDPSDIMGNLGLMFFESKAGMERVSKKYEVTNVAEKFERIGDVCLVTGKSTGYTISSYNPKWMVKACWAKCAEMASCIGFDVSFDANPKHFSLCTLHEGVITGAQKFSAVPSLTDEVPKNPPVADVGNPNAIEPPERALGCYSAVTPAPTPAPTLEPTPAPTPEPTPAPTDPYYLKYKAMWPHCSNIECGTWPLSTFKAKCTSFGNCAGFSYTVNNPATGSGCLKNCGSYEAHAGYGQNTHGYWAKGAKSTTMKVKYWNKWPHCANIACGHWYLSDAQQMCQAYRDCTGFSYTAGNPARGHGCLKRCGRHEFGGYGYHSHLYWSK